jgi:1,4-dihydroxy-2-naphthoate octaprenyltransferase
VFLAVAYAVLFYFSLLFPLAPLVFFTLLLAIPAALITLTAKTSRELILALKLTSLVGLLYGLGLGAAFAF